MKLDRLLKDVETKKIYNDTNPEITGVSYNSADVKPGYVFVAIKGFKTDGHKYIGDALKRGAAAIIAEDYTEISDAVQIIVENSRIAEAMVSANFFERPSEKFKLIGITGTNGKTTVTYLVKHILDSLGYKTGLIGTNQNMIGDRVLETGRTTPDSFELQKLFHEMVLENVTHVIMEVSSHALELSRVYGCNYEVGAFTNLTQDHLDFHITMDNYAKAKEKLFKQSKYAVINGDDAYGAKMAENAPCEVKTYGMETKCDLTAYDVSYDKNKVCFLLDGTKYSLLIPGKFSVYNALCAIGICRALGLSENDISRTLAIASGVKGRAEIVDTGDADYTIMIDYAHTPDGIENILKAARGFAKGRVVIVFGCGGDRDNTKRAIMGKIAGELADFVVITSDNPRTEKPLSIIKMVEEGAKQAPAPYIVVENRRDAIKYAIENAKKDDVIILAGKGHETYQILNEGTIHFDEREVVHEILFGGNNLE